MKNLRVYNRVQFNAWNDKRLNWKSLAETRNGRFLFRRADMTARKLSCKRLSQGDFL